MTCNNCTHWIGEPVNHCELGPNQYPLCIQMQQAEKEETFDAEAIEEMAGKDGLKPGSILAVLYSIARNGGL